MSYVPPKKGKQSGIQHRSFETMDKYLATGDIGTPGFSNNYADYYKANEYGLSRSSPGHPYYTDYNKGSTTGNTGSAKGGRRRKSRGGSRKNKRKKTRRRH